jgi:vancomycin resistance protein YoaR
MQKKWRILGYWIMGVGLGIVVTYGLLRVVWKGKVYANTYVGSIEVSLLTKEQAREKLKLANDNIELKLVFNQGEYVIPGGWWELDLEESVNRAYAAGRRMGFRQAITILKGERVVVAPWILIDQGELERWVENIMEEAEDLPREANIVFANDKIKIENGADGKIVNRELLKEMIKDKIEQVEDGEIEIPLRDVARELNQAEMDALSSLATDLASKKVVIIVDEAQVRLGGEKLVTLLNTKPQVSEIFDELFVESLTAGLAKTYERESENARLVFEGGRARDFAPGKDGLLFDREINKQEIIEGLKQLVTDEKDEVEIALSLIYTPPLISTAEANELGIEERLGRGESYYVGSIAGRVHNVGLTSKKITGTIVAPGEEFSFNKAVGEISGATGFAPAYVIKNGRTELGDGGGVCQVSTTVFRAAMSAGLPITERWPHAYRVSYYEQKSSPGLDATIYAPSKDLRFLNDTSGHILVQIIDDPSLRHLIVDIYGSDDGRVSEISKPLMWGVTPPPPDLYQDDPTLPEGQVKQVDWSAWGAKTSFDYKVRREGEILFEKTFNSSYRAWQNVYLRGTKTE